MTARERVMARLNAKPVKSRKYINIHMEESQLERLETIADILTERSGKRVSRNMLIEDAIDSLLTDLQGEDLDQIAKKFQAKAGASPREGQPEGGGAQPPKVDTPAMPRA